MQQTMQERGETQSDAPADSSAAASQPAAPANVRRIHVNPDKCQGHNRCRALAPTLFQFDEYGNAREIGDGTVPPGLEKQAALARANCPEFAIEMVSTAAATPSAASSGPGPSADRPAPRLADAEELT